MNREQQLVQDIKVVTSAWASEDDWGVPTIMASTVGELIDALVAGDDPQRLIEHAKHVAGTCQQRECYRTIPFYWALQQHEEAEFKAAYRARHANER